MLFVGLFFFHFERIKCQNKQIAEPKCERSSIVMKTVDDIVVRIITLSCGNDG